MECLKVVYIVIPAFILNPVYVFLAGFFDYTINQLQVFTGNPRNSSPTATFTLTINSLQNFPESKEEFSQKNVKTEL